MSGSLNGSLSPCAGKCSTVFGDQVCRGCRRFSYEVIEWNRYSEEQKLLIWKRLDEQLDRIVYWIRVRKAVMFMRLYGFVSVRPNY